MKNWKINWKIISVAVVAGLSIFSYLNFNPSSLKKLPVIAMTQIIEHHTLDTVRKGFIDGLADAGYTDGKTIQLIYENAHGNITTASQIATKFSAQSPQLLVALSTQSAQVLLPISQSKKVPLIFTAVTDPKAARLTGFPTVTGMSDFMPALPQLKLMKGIVPSLKTLGVLHNPSEVNSVSYLKHVEEEAVQLGITLVYAAVSKTSDAVGATQSLVGKVDAIYFPNDNTSMAAAQAIAQTGHQHNIPVFANDSASVERGCVAALAYDRIAMGKKTAEMAVKILRGAKPSSLPISTDTPLILALNEKSLQKLGLSAQKWMAENTEIKVKLLSH